MTELTRSAEETAAAEKTAVVNADTNAEKGKPNDAEPAETPLEALASICTVLVIGLFTFAFIFQNFEIPSGSMKQTLLVGDHVVVDRGTLAPQTKWAPWIHYRPVQRGDMIVFMKPNPEQPDLILVKRAIGLPGDRIKLHAGVLYRNGEAQVEPYAAMPTHNGNPEDDYSPPRDDFPAYGAPPSSLTPELWTQQLPSHVKDGELIVPDGYVFAMGDNRTESLDSRFWGFVPKENIMGRPMFVYWSFKTPDDQEEKNSMGDRIGFFFHIIIHIFDGTRWGRTLHVVR